MSGYINPTKLPEPFYEIHELTSTNYQKRENQLLDRNILKNLLRDFEKGKGSTYENAKSELLKYIPLEAVDSLWKLRYKFISQDQKMKDLYFILSEIGTDKVARLLSQDKFHSGNEAFYYMIALSKLNSPLTIEALGYWATSLDSSFPTNIMAINILKNINKPETIAALVNDSNFLYMDSLEADSNEEDFLKRYKRLKEGKVKTLRDNFVAGVLLSGIHGIGQYYKNKAAKVLCSGLVTAPFLPLDISLDDQTNILKGFQLHRYRMNAVLSLCDRWGYKYLENCWIASQTRKKEREAIFLTGCYLKKGLDPQPAESYIKLVFNSNLNSNEQHMKAIFLADSLLHSEAESLTIKYHSLIQGLINHKEQLVAKSVAASVFYADYRPLIPKLLQENFCLELIPAIVFSARISNNPDSIHFLDNNQRFPDEMKKWEVFYENVIAEYEDYKNNLESFKNVDLLA